MLPEIHCLEWPDGMGSDRAYGNIVQLAELLRKLHDEIKYPCMNILEDGIARDRDAALTSSQQRVDLLDERFCAAGKRIHRPQN